MIASFRELGASCQIIGDGIYSWTGLRQPIPPEFWPDLRFDFETNKASSDKFSYSHVTIDQDGAAGPQGDIVARIVAWLTQHRPENSKAAKKVLAPNARAEFGSGYTERAFNEAYREVYQRRRGRPKDGPPRRESGFGSRMAGASCSLWRARHHCCCGPSRRARRSRAAYGLSMPFAQCVSSNWCWT
jgi:hypothetical protein